MKFEFVSRETKFENKTKQWIIKSSWASIKTIENFLNFYFYCEVWLIEKKWNKKNPQHSDCYKTRTLWVFHATVLHISVFQFSLSWGAIIRHPGKCVSWVGPGNLSETHWPEPVQLHSCCQQLRVPSYNPEISGVNTHFHFEALQSVCVC